MSVAQRTREAVRAEPFLLDALRAGVVNYTAAARHLDVDGDEESVAAALRRFANDLEDAADSEDSTATRTSVRIRRGVTVAADADAVADDADAPPDTDDALLTVGDVALVDDGGDAAAINAKGIAGPRALERVLGVLRAAEIEPIASATAGSELVVAVDGRAGPDALRLVEDALDR